MAFQNYTGMSFNGSKSPMPPFDEVSILAFGVVLAIFIIILINGGLELH